MNLMQKARMENAVNKANELLREAVSSADSRLTFSDVKDEIEQAISHARRLCEESGAPFNIDTSALEEFETLKSLDAERVASLESRKQVSFGLSGMERVVYDCNTQIYSVLFDYRLDGKANAIVKMAREKIGQAVSKCRNAGGSFQLDEVNSQRLEELLRMSDERLRSWREWLDAVVSVAALEEMGHTATSQGNGYLSIGDASVARYLKYQLDEEEFGLVTIRQVPEANALYARAFSRTSYIPAEYESFELWFSPMDSERLSAPSLVTFGLFVSAITGVEFKFSPHPLSSYEVVEASKDLEGYRNADGREIDYTSGVVQMPIGERFGFGYLVTKFDEHTAYYGAAMSGLDSKIEHFGAFSRNLLSSLGRKTTDSGTCFEEIDIQSLNGLEFEQVCEQLVKKMGFETEVTKASGDGGIDIVATNNSPLLSGKYIIQCKRYSGSVGEPIIRDLYGVVTSERANKGILMTSGTFTRQAIDFAEGKPIELIDGIGLRKLMKEHDLAGAIEPNPAAPSFAEAPAELRQEFIELVRRIYGFAERVFAAYDEAGYRGEFLTEGRYSCLSNMTWVKMLDFEIIAYIDYILGVDNPISDDEVCLIREILGYSNMDADDIEAIVGLYPEGIENVLLPSYALLRSTLPDDISEEDPDFAYTLFEMIGSTTSTMFGEVGVVRVEEFLKHLREIDIALDGND